jgi:DNA-binding NarL/FixJ family response regulator
MLMADGKSNKEVERVLSLSESTVKHYVQSTLARLVVQTRIEAVVELTRWRASLAAH